MDISRRWSVRLVVDSGGASPRRTSGAPHGLRHLLRLGYRSPRGNLFEIHMAEVVDVALEPGHYRRANVSRSQIASVSALYRSSPFSSILVHYAAMPASRMGPLGKKVCRGRGQRAGGRIELTSSSPSRPRSSA